MAACRVNHEQAQQQDDRLFFHTRIVCMRANIAVFPLPEAFVLQNVPHLFQASGSGYNTFVPVI